MSIIDIIKKNDILKVVLILAAVYFFMKYYHRETLDNVGAIDMPVMQPMVVQPILSAPSLAQPNSVNVLAPAVTKDAMPVNTVSAQQAQLDKIVAGPTQLTTSDLLPKYDAANDFAKENPVSKLLQEQNFLQAGYHMGINTVVQSNKIPYLDIRSCPPIPKQTVGPFLNSSFEQPAGSSRRQFEIGN